MGFGSKQGFAIIIPPSQNILRTETVISASVTPLTGGGGNALRTETVITTGVVLAAGSYP